MSVALTGPSTQFFFFQQRLRLNVSSGAAHTFHPKLSNTATERGVVDGFKLP